MRLRNAVLAAASALALALAVPASATAVGGEFRYKYRNFLGEQLGALFDPAGRACVNLPEAGRSEPAYAPNNRTNSTATVFPEFDCEGDTYYVLRPGGRAGDRLLVRSVVFS
ncbi:hypothetical protein ACGFZP_20145 [Kitasatospora sp. NPDC048239]|uniref:hypothetical protein n=1 Tax=Kitasatospora sp. NPDC048239 TaxID=3364046 RepID=UPI00371A998B